MACRPVLFGSMLEPAWLFVVQIEAPQLTVIPAMSSLTANQTVMSLGDVAETVDGSP
jgi:hypothetical protein